MTHFTLSVDFTLLAAAYDYMNLRKREKRVPNSSLSNVNNYDYTSSSSIFHDQGKSNASIIVLPHLRGQRKEIGEDLTIF